MIIKSAADLDRLVSDGGITEDDAGEVRDFMTLLSKLGPAGPPRNVEDLVAMEEYCHDRDPEFAAKLRQRINERRSKDGC